MKDAHWCCICGFTTTKQSTFSMHMIMKHYKDRPHKCTFCSKTFAVRTQLNHHEINAHTRPILYCYDDNCTLKFKSHTARMIHYVKRHMKHLKLFNPLDNNLVQCVSCDAVHKKSAIYYHVGKCNPQSLFHPDNVLVDPSTFVPEYVSPEEEALSKMSKDLENSVVDEMEMPMNLDEELFDIGDATDTNVDVIPNGYQTPPPKEDSDDELIALLKDVLNQ